MISKFFIFIKKLRVFNFIYNYQLFSNKDGPFDKNKKSF